MDGDAVRFDPLRARFASHACVRMARSRMLASPGSAVARVAAVQVGAVQDTPP